jgi:hypothetical protein
MKVRKFLDKKSNIVVTWSVTNEGLYADAGFTVSESGESFSFYFGEASDTKNKEKFEAVHNLINELCLFVEAAEKEFTKLNSTLGKAILKEEGKKATKTKGKKNEAK